MAAKAATKINIANKSAIQNDARALDDHSTLNAINQILQRSESLEVAALNSLELVFGMRKVIGAYIANFDVNGPYFNFTHKSDHSRDLTHGASAHEIASELQRAYPQLPDWPLRLDIKLSGVGTSVFSLWLKRIDVIEENVTPNFLILVFAEPTELPCGDIHSLEVASSILCHKISLGEITPRKSKDPLESPSRFRLSERQITISKMILDGLTNKEIAQELNLSAATIRYECVRLYERLGAKNRASAAAILQNLFSGGHDAVTARAYINR